jgi:hypothetical protein
MRFALCQTLQEIESKEEEHQVTTVARDQHGKDVTIKVAIRKYNTYYELPKK